MIPDFVKTKPFKVCAIAFLAWYFWNDPNGLAGNVQDGFAMLGQAGDKLLAFIKAF